MQIPEYFRVKIIRAFGETGRAWLAELPHILNTCIHRWRLTDCTVAEGLSVNYVCFAHSPDYGGVVLKVGSPNPEIYTEMTALSLYNGRYICKCYDYDKNLGAMLLERVTPGENLTVIPGTRDQLMIAADLIAKLPIPLTEDHGLPTYTQWLQRAFTRARREEKVGAQMLSLVDAAEALFGELETGDRPKVLLHGDLHHWNILQDENGQWKAIDPQGVIGIACMESARFMNNHIDMVEEGEKLAHLDAMVTVFGATCNEPKRVMAICLFVLFVLSTCWTFEEAEPVKADLIRSIGNCQLIFDYIHTVS